MLPPLVLICSIPGVWAERKTADRKWKRQGKQSDGQTGGRTFSVIAAAWLLFFASEPFLPCAVSNEALSPGRLNLSTVAVVVTVEKQPPCLMSVAQQLLLHAVVLPRETKFLFHSAFAECGASGGSGINYYPVVTVQDLLDLLCTLPAKSLFDSVHGVETFIRCQCI